MKDTVILKLTRAEVMALDELANFGAETFFCVVGGNPEFRTVGWDKKIAATACDKLREAARGDLLPELNRWTHFLSMIDT